MNTVYFFPNGNTAFFDDGGEQIPELQQSWFKLYCQFLESHGIDPTKEIKFTLPNGMIAKPFKRSDTNTYGWELADNGKYAGLEQEWRTDRKRRIDEG